MGLGSVVRTAVSTVITLPSAFLRSLDLDTGLGFLEAELSLSNVSGSSKHFIPPRMFHKLRRKFTYILLFGSSANSNDMWAADLGVTLKKGAHVFIS